MRILAGTSGYAYKEWKGPFYPEDLADGDMLAYYASRLPAVEVNNTFYRMPNARLIERLDDSTPESFRFVLKATRKITHSKGRLVEVADLVEYVTRTTAPLGDKLGAHLFQLPPYARADADVLRSFLDMLPEGHRAAFEFRHASWLDDEIYGILRDHDAAMVLADGEKVEIPRIATASWGYLRLRRPDYDGEALRDWLGFVRSQDWDHTYAFFKHEDEGAGPKLAARFLELAAGD